MLNISHNKLNEKVSLEGYEAHSQVFHSKQYKLFNRLIGAFAIIGILFLFLPWTKM